MADTSEADQAASGNDSYLVHSATPLDNTPIEPTQNNELPFNQPNQVSPIINPEVVAPDMTMPLPNPTMISSDGAEILSSVVPPVPPAPAMPADLEAMPPQTDLGGMANNETASTPTDPNAYDPSQFVIPSMNNEQQPEQPEQPEQPGQPNQPGQPQQQ